MKGMNWVVALLMVIGSLNWGLVGIFNFDLVEWILGSVPVVQDIVYIVVGLAGLWGISFLFPKKHQ